MSQHNFATLCDLFLTPAYLSVSSSLCQLTVSLFLNYYVQSVSRVLSLLAYYCPCVTTKLLAAEFCLKQNRTHFSYIITPLGHPEREACECTNTYWIKSNVMVALPSVFLDKLSWQQVSKWRRLRVESDKLMSANKHLSYNLKLWDSTQLIKWCKQNLCFCQIESTENSKEIFQRQKARYSLA